jgi:hypothetical protein
MARLKDILQPTSAVKLVVEAVYSAAEAVVVVKDLESASAT